MNSTKLFLSRAVLGSAPRRPTQVCLKNQVQMRQKHMHVNHVEYHELNRRLHHQVRSHDYAKAMATLEEMKEKKIEPDPVSYSRILRMVTDKQDSVAALKTIHEMVKKGITPSVVTANSVLHLLCRKGDKEEAELFFEEMSSKLGVIRDERSYLEIIRFLASKEDVDRCKYYHHKMKEEGLEPTLAIYTDMIWVFSKKKLYKDAVALYDEIKRHHVIKADQMVYNLILDVAAKIKDPKLINECVKGLWDLGVEPHPEHYDAIRDL